MADLGAVGLIASPTYALTGGVIAGTVRNAQGQPVRRRLALYHRQFLSYINSAYSDPDSGAYQMNCNVNHGTAEVFAVCLDDAAEPQHNDLILGRLVGV